MARKNYVKSHSKPPGPQPEGPNSPLGERLDDVLKFYKVGSYKSLEDETGIARGSISRYMGSPLEPTRATTDKMADHFGCSREALWNYLKRESNEFPHPEEVKDSSRNTDTKECKDGYTDQSKSQTTQERVSELKGSNVVPGDTRVSIGKDSSSDEPNLRSGHGIRIVSTREGKALKIPESYELYKIVSSAPMLFDKPDFTNLVVDSTADIEDGMLCWAHVFRGKHKGYYIGYVRVADGKVQIDDVHVPRTTIVIKEDDVDLSKVEGFL